MLGTSSFSTRPLSTGARVPRAFQLSANSGEFGWASWSYSRQAKLNAWGWSGAGNIGKIVNWATLGNAVYVRGDSDNRVYVMQPNVFLGDSEPNLESTSVEVSTQWLDFGKPGKRKALTGVDFDGKNVTTLEVYVSAGGDRAGVLAETLAISSTQGGWTYSGEMLPLSCDGTEFKLRFVGQGNTETQINRITLYYEEVQS